jgi:hypothetical protein
VSTVDESIRNKLLAAIDDECVAQVRRMWGNLLEAYVSATAAEFDAANARFRSGVEEALAARKAALAVIGAL